jgi:hypothetical protein
MNKIRNMLNLKKKYKKEVKYGSTSSSGMPPYFNVSYAIL